MSQDVIIVCDEKSYRLHADKFPLLSNGREIIGLVTETEFPVNCRYKALGSLKDLRRIIPECNGSEIMVVSTEPPDIDHELQHYFMAVKHVQFHDADYQVRDFRFTDKQPYLKWKYTLEYSLALLSLPIALPLMAVIGILVKLTSAGPMLYRPERIGENLRPFKVYKFRTMVRNAHTLNSHMEHINEMSGGGLFKSSQDPRVTWLGRWLRKFSLDELPQVFNILRGEMTIIGPRPLSTPIELYKSHQLRRFTVRPGLGCVWQAYYRQDTDFDRWIQSDLEYIDRMSPLLDMKLFLRIIWNVIFGKGAR